MLNMGLVSKLLADNLFCFWVIFIALLATGEKPHTYASRHNEGIFNSVASWNAAGDTGSSNPDMIAAGSTYRWREQGILMSVEEHNT